MIITKWRSPALRPVRVGERRSQFWADHLGVREERHFETNLS
jgi:hypothetical protein